MRRAERAEKVELQLQVEDVELLRGRIEAATSRKVLPFGEARMIARQAAGGSEFRRQKSARGAGGRESLQLASTEHSLAVAGAVDQLAQRQSHRDFVDARPVHVSADGEKSPPLAAIHAQCRVAESAVEQDVGHPRIGFDVAQ